MTKKLNKKEELEKTKKIWYKKLKDEGFEDIEPHENTLKSWSYKFADRNVDEITAKQVYYRMANHFLNDHQFNSILEKVIWEYHANGIAVRDIASQLSKAKVTKTSYDTIWRIVGKIKKAMYAFYAEEITSDS